MQLRYASLPKHLRLTVAFTVAVGIVVLSGLIVSLMADGIPGDFSNKDFANYWTAGRLVLSGQVLDLFGPHPGYFAHLTEVFGPDYPWHNWSYPPHYLLFVWPLGFFGYKAAMVVFLAASGLLFAWGLRVFCGRDDPLVWIAAAPAVVYNVWTAQNGFLTAGLALGALGLRERRPILAGVLLGLLTVKPQLGILFPFLLVAERRWSMIASAAATTVALVLLSAFAFGVDAWKGYVAEVLPYQTLVMRELTGAFLAMLPSTYGSFRFWGLPADPALMLHMLVAVPAFVVSVAAFFLAPDARWRAAVLLVGTFLVTPYALTYDLGLLAAALPLLYRSVEADPVRGEAALWLVATAMLLPLLMMAMGLVWLPLSPLVLIAVFALTLRHGGVVEAAVVRFPALARALRLRPSSRAAASG